MIKSWRDIPGYFDFQSVYDQAVSEAMDGDMLIEVGCYLGKSLAYMAEKVRESGKRVSLAAVDTWDDHAYQGWWLNGYDVANPWPPPQELIGLSLRDAFRFGMNATKTTTWELRQPSVVAAASFVDGITPFVFIDASHLYGDVKADIAAWTPKVRTGGLLAGHDYIPLWPGVVQAVDEAFGSRVEKRGSSWLVRL